MGCIMFTFLNVKVTSNNLKHHSKAAFSLAGIYILSAVRTPIGKPNGALSEFSALQLGSFAFREALQRALVPGKDLQNLFFSCDVNINCSNEIINRTGLPKTANMSHASSNGMKSLMEAIKFLLTGDRAVCMAGGANSTSNLPVVVKEKYINHIQSMQKNIFLNLEDIKKCAKQDFQSFLEAKESGAFLDEIIKIHFTTKGQQIVTGEDEVETFHFSTGEISKLKYSTLLADGAVALIISTEDYIRNNSLSPLAKIISFSEGSAQGGNIASVQCLAIEKALKMANCQSEEIRRWEVDSTFCFASDCMNHFKIDSSLINKNGGVFSTGYGVGMSGMKAVCHLTHSLNAGELGCAVTCDFHGSVSAVIIRKLSGSLSGTPQLTLYTKSICPLCDELKEGLKAFEGRFTLKEIDIEIEENKNYEDLFKYEIPVLFLDGRFLCKHKLDAKLLSRRLSAYESVS